MRSVNIQNTLVLAAALALLAWLPAPARAQFTLTLSPSTVTGPPGSIDLIVYGSLANLANTPADFDTDGFNLISGPNTANLNTAIVFSDDNLTSPIPQIPLALAANQVLPIAPLFLLNIDPGAPLGVYKGNFSITYGGRPAAGKFSGDFTINVGTPSPVPEASTLPLLTLGVGYLGYVLFTARRRRATVR